MKKGFSLLEVLTVMIILIIIIGTIVMISTSRKRSSSKNSIEASLQNEAININKIYQNEVRNCQSIGVLENAPEILEYKKGYIFLDTKTDTLMMKEVNSDYATIMYIGKDIKQDVLFEKVNNKTISAELILEKDGENYDVKTNTEFNNMAKNADVLGRKGNCLEFNYSDDDFFLNQFIFYDDDNEKISGDTIGMIDDINQTVNIEVKTDDITKLTPNISIFGENVSFDSINNEKYDIIKSTPLDFTNPREIYVFSKDDSYKVYTVTVTPTP